MQSLLFIEDDGAIRQALRMALEDEGYEVREAADGVSGLANFAAQPPDLVLLDLRLPDISGFEVCRTLRQHSIVPIIMVTAQTDTHDLVAGLEAGADDYVTKPVVAKELAARIRAALRRTQLIGKVAGAHSQVTRVADVEINRDLSVVTKGGAELSLTKTEYHLLCEYLDHAAGDDAANSVGAAARRHRHDVAHRLRRIALCCCVEGYGRNRCHKDGRSFRFDDDHCFRGNV